MNTTNWTDADLAAIAALYGFTRDVTWEADGECMYRGGVRIHGWSQAQHCWSFMDLPAKSGPVEEARS